MWELDRTERLVTRLLPLVIVLAVLLLALMTMHVRPRQLSAAFAPSHGTPVVEARE